LFINVSGSFVIGLLWGWHNDQPFSPNMTAFLFIGLLGGYTTFSTFSLENLQLLQEGAIRQAVMYVLMTCAGGLLAAYAGLRLSGHFLQS
jgi:CrcB protein